MTLRRVASVDLLRGLVMAIMAIDHTRDFVHAAAMDFPPENHDASAAVDRAEPARPLIHALAIALTALRYGAAPFLFTPPPTLGTPRTVFPPDYGWSLGTVYLVWAIVLLLLYPVCLWFARLTQRRREWWIGYL